MQKRYWFQVNGSSFQDYESSPIYRAHCATAKFLSLILKENGLKHDSWNPVDGACSFRMLKDFRSSEANKLRNLVAKRVKSERKRIRAVGKTIAMTTVTHNDAYIQAHSEASRMLAIGDIRAFSVKRNPEMGRVIEVETDQGWNPVPFYCDFYQNA